MSELWRQLTDVLSGSLPNLLAALAILVVGWIVALLVAKLVRAALRRTRLDDRLAALFRGERERTDVDVGRWVAQGVFYMLMLLVVIGVCQALNLTLVTEPLNSLLEQVFAFLPKLLGAAILMGIAWLAATILRRVVTAALGAARIDDKVRAGSPSTPTLATSIGEAVYWLVFLLFLPAVLGALQLEGILRPVQNMFDDFLGYLPNLVAATLITLVGWFVAGIVRRIVSNLLGAAGVDRLGQKVGMPGAVENQRISGALGLIVYVLILVPVLISALNSLQLYTITEPATRMLYVAFDTVPLVLGAAIVLLLAWAIGRILSGLVANLLDMVGFDTFLKRIGMIKEGRAGQPISQIAGTLVLAAVMLFAVIESSDILGFEMLSDLASRFLVFASQILAGLLIFVVGFYLAGLASGALRASGAAQSALLSRVAWIAIVLFSSAVALRRMGLANDIIDLAFGLLLGAIAVAAAIAFGIGGREVAGRTLQGWFDSTKQSRGPGH